MLSPQTMLLAQAIVWLPIVVNGAIEIPRGLEARDRECNLAHTFTAPSALTLAGALAQRAVTAPPSSCIGIAVNCSTALARFGVSAPVRVHVAVRPA
jgi:hypothetical protein